MEVESSMNSTAVVIGLFLFSIPTMSVNFVATFHFRRNCAIHLALLFFIGSEFMVFGCLWQVLSGIIL